MILLIIKPNSGYGGAPLSAYVRGVPVPAKLDYGGNEWL